MVLNGRPSPGGYAWKSRVHAPPRSATAGAGPFRNGSGGDTDFAGVTTVSVIQNGALSMEKKRSLIAGAAFDEQGRSTSKMTYSFFEEQGGDAWVFAFHPFYAWNGCSNQAFAMTVSNTVTDVEEFYLCPIGTSPPHSTPSPPSRRPCTPWLLQRHAL